MDTTYVVVVQHNFSDEMTVYDCGKEYDKAKDCLEEIWTKYYNEELRNNSELYDLYEDDCYHEDEYACITWGDGYETDFTLATLTKYKKGE